MKSIHLFICRMLFISTLFFSIQTSAAPLIIGVENKDWYPHYMWKDGKLDGIDVRVIKIVFKRLNIDFKFKPLPWKRLINEIEWKKIDGGVDLSFSKKRDHFVYYPKEHLTQEGKAFYIKKNGNLIFSGNLKTLKIKSMALMRGYNWDREIKELGNPQVYRFDEYSQIFKLLASGRVDVFGGYVLSTSFILNKTGYSDKIIMVEPPIKIQKHYMGFAKKPGYKKLVKKFSTELKKFKISDDYSKIFNYFMKNN